MRRWVPLILLPVSLALSSCAPSAVGAAATPPAVVGGKALPLTTLQRQFKLGQEGIGGTLTLSQQASLNRSVLTALIRLRLLEAGSGSIGIPVTPASAAGILTTFERQNGGLKGLLQQMRLQNQQPAYTAVSAKFTPIGFEVDQILGQVARRLAENQIAKNPALMTQYHVRQILVSTKGTALAVRAQLVAGGSWTALAKEYSQDVASASQGGDIGLIAVDETVAPFQRAMLALAHTGTCAGVTNGACVSAVSAPVHSHFGWQVLQVLGKQAAAPSQVPALLQQSQFQPLLRAALGPWFQHLSTTTPIAVDPRFGSWNGAIAGVVAPPAPRGLSASGG